MHNPRVLLVLILASCDVGRVLEETATEMTARDPVPEEESRVIVLDPAMMELDRELRTAVRPIEQRIKQRGISMEELTMVAGDATAEAELLGMTEGEYLGVYNRIVEIIQRGRRLMLHVPNGPLMPGLLGLQPWEELPDDPSANWICTDDREVEELEDGTIIITDTNVCEPIFEHPDMSWPEDPGGEEPTEIPPLFTQFEQDCKLAGGEVEGGFCQCAQRFGCGAMVITSTTSTVLCASLLGCAGSAIFWVITLWQCDQKPCARVNRHYGLSNG